MLLDFDDAVTLALVLGFADAVTLALVLVWEDLAVAVVPTFVEVLWVDLLLAVAGFFFEVVLVAAEIKGADEVIRKKLNDASRIRFISPSGPQKINSPAAQPERRNKITLFCCIGRG